jgi:hypothetical protein
MELPLMSEQILQLRQLLELFGQLTAQTQWL